MGLKYIIEKEADVPADHKALYHEKEIEVGSGANVRKIKAYVLDVDEVVPRERFVDFRTNNQTLINENKALKERYADIDDPDRARAVLKITKDVELDDAEKYLRKGGIEAIIGERTKVIKEESDKKVKEQTDRALRAESALSNEKINNEIMRCCARLSLHPGAEAAILGFAQGVFSILNGQVTILGTDGHPRPAKDGTGNVTVTEWLQEDILKKHAYLLKESTGSGASGSGGGGGGTNHITSNPWDKKTFNLTQQGEILRKDPARAQRLKQAAGVA